MANTSLSEWCMTIKGEGLIQGRKKAHKRIYGGMHNVDAMETDKLYSIQAKIMAEDDIVRSILDHVNER